MNKKLSKAEKDKRREQRMREQSDLFHSELIDSNIMEDPMLKKYGQNEDIFENIKKSQEPGELISTQNDKDLKQQYNEILKNEQQINED